VPHKFILLTKHSNFLRSNSVNHRFKIVYLVAKFFWVGGRDVGSREDMDLY